MTTTPKMTKLHIRLEQREQEAAKAFAAEAETTLVKLFTEAVQQYAAGPMPPPRPAAVPQSEMRETRLLLPTSTVERAKERASREGVVLSDAIYEQVIQASLNRGADAMPALAS